MWELWVAVMSDTSISQAGTRVVWVLGFSSAIFSYPHGSAGWWMWPVTKNQEGGELCFPGLRWEMENLAFCLYCDPLLDASSFLGLVEPPGHWHHGFWAYQYCWNTKMYTWSWDGWLTNKIKNSPWLPQLSMFIGSRTRKMFNLDTLNTLKSLFHFAFPHARKWCVYS